MWIHLHAGFEQGFLRPVQPLIHLHQQFSSPARPSFLVQTSQSWGGSESHWNPSWALLPVGWAAASLLSGPTADCKSLSDQSHGQTEQHKSEWWSWLLWLMPWLRHPKLPNPFVEEMKADPRVNFEFGPNFRFLEALPVTSVLVFLQVPQQIEAWDHVQRCHK